MFPYQSLLLFLKKPRHTQITFPYWNLLLSMFPYRRLFSNPVPDTPAEAVGVVYECFQDDVTVAFIKLANQRCATIQTETDRTKLHVTVSHCQSIYNYYKVQNTDCMCVKTASFHVNCFWMLQWKALTQINGGYAAMAKDSTVSYAWLLVLPSCLSWCMTGSKVVAMNVHMNFLNCTTHFTSKFYVTLGNKIFLYCITLWCWKPLRDGVDSIIMHFSELWDTILNWNVYCLNTALLFYFTF